LNRLEIDFCGEIKRLATDEQLTFGRAGDLIVDDNPFLHRRLGKFMYEGGWWWLANVGTHLPMAVEDRITASSITLSAGANIPLVFGAVRIRFTAGSTSYEIEVRQEETPIVVADEEALSLMETTIDAGSMPLTPEQLLLLVALCEPRLIRGPSAPLPANEDIAQRFGWTITKYNRKLDNVCSKFARRGVAGLVGGSGKSATSRRAVLVEHVLRTSMVTAEMLPLLKQHAA
jgi:hypothetical protein